MELHWECRINVIISSILKCKAQRLELVGLGVSKRGNVQQASTNFVLIDYT